MPKAGSLLGGACRAAGGDGLAAGVKGTDVVTATRTALFTDLAEYTARVSRTDRDGLRRILQQHEQLVRPIVERPDGPVFKCHAAA